MKSLASYLLCGLALVAACGSTKKSQKAQTTQSAGLAVEQDKALFEVLEQATGNRIGFVEKITYDDGNVIYWVTGLDRSLRHGYMLRNGASYRYEQIGGQRAGKTFLGADTYSANARRILRHGRPVKLQPISVQKLMKEYEPQKTQPAAKTEEGESEEE